jgi:hypothetical protein
MMIITARERARKINTNFHVYISMELCVRECKEEEEEENIYGDVLYAFAPRTEHCSHSRRERGRGGLGGKENFIHQPRGGWGRQSAGREKRNFFSHSHLRWWWDGVMF